MTNKNLKRIGKTSIIRLNLVGSLLASIIFLVAIIELISWRLESLKDYFKYIYPMLNTLVIWIFAFSYLLKLWFFKSCIYTKIVVILYLVIQTINLISIGFKIGLEAYDRVVYPILMFGILFITVIKFARWVFQNRY